MEQDIVPLSLEYYDNNNKENDKFLKKIKYIGGFEKNKDFTEIDFYDKNKNIIRTSRFEVLGCFISKSNTWVWGWSMPMINNRMITSSRKLLNYGIDIYGNVLLKRELITSRFKLSNPIQKEIYSAMASYLSKKPFVFNYKFYYNKIDEIYTKINDEENILDIATDFEEDYVQFYLFILD